MKNLFGAFKKFESLATLVALIAVMAVISVINSSFLTFNNISNLLLQVSTNGFIAFGMTFVILTGGIDLSVGSILALSGALTAGLIGSGIPAWGAIIFALVFGGILGAFNGVLVSYGKLAPFIVTLATMTIFRGATLVFTNGNPIVKKLGENDLFSFLGQGYLLEAPFPAILMFIVFIMLYFLLHKTSFGKSVYAIGGNEKAAYVSGVKINKSKIIIYSISGVMAAISGLIVTSQLSSATPTAGASYEMDAIASVVLGGTSLSGGKGRIVGTLFGCLLIGVINNGLNIIGVSSFWQQVVKGVVILVAVLLDSFRTKKSA